jgi:hypothetical protein
MVSKVRTLISRNISLASRSWRPNSPCAASGDHANVAIGLLKAVPGRIQAGQPGSQLPSADAACWGAQVTVTNQHRVYRLISGRDAHIQVFAIGRDVVATDGDSRYDLVLSNMKESNVNVTVSALGGPGKPTSFRSTFRSRLIRLR